MSKVTFLSGVGTATGANFMVEKNGKRFLVDCGLIQGSETAFRDNHEPFSFNPDEVDVLLVTHAHMDHIGRIPKLVREGFRGVIYSTPQTRDLSAVMFDDAVGLIARESKETGKPPLYEEQDVAKALSLWRTHEYHSPFEFIPGLSAEFYDSGHILGSAMIKVSSGEKNFLFTGDLGNSPSPLLPDTEIISDVDYLITESVYGDRNHGSKDERDAHFLSVLRKGIAKGGVILIPAFSIERTQVILYKLNDFIEGGLIAKVPVCVDSPLASKVTAIYKNNTDLFKEGVRKDIADGDDIFAFPGLTFIRTMEESRALDNNNGAKIILAGSGMSMGGRVVRHEKTYLSNPNATVVMVGYQVPGSLGRHIEEGEGVVVIEGEHVRIHATIEKIDGFSSHKDSDHIVEFISHMKDRVKKVFVAMGEPKSSIFLTQRLRGELSIDALYPERGSSVEIDF
jgi:metallo-beta-lactamase family protein